MKLISLKTIIHVKQKGSLMSYNVKSLGYRTDFIFNRFNGSVTLKDKYIVATTDSNPNYFWGNFLLYPTPPQAGDYQSWVQDFKKEFTNPAISHMTFAWDSITGEKGEISEFIKNGFKLENSVVLSTKEVKTPPKFNDLVKINIIKDDKDFERCIEVQVACANDYLSKESWERFYRKSMELYRSMIESHKGYWFGATLDEKIVGSLGIFIDNDIARYQIVSTDPEFQRQGVCSTLVFKSADYILKNTSASTLVMVADEDYHAAKIYESVGFKPTEKQIGLCWYDKEKHS